MADIPGNIDKMNDIEIAFDASVSEQLFNKMGANINALIDLSGNFQIFTTGAVWVVPEGIQRVTMLGCGGGGGGGGGTTSQLYGAGAGGAGAPFSVFSAAVTAGDSVTITIAAGGGGGPAQTGLSQPGIAGGTGGTTIFSPTADPLVNFYGGGGGDGGTDSSFTFFASGGAPRSTGSYGGAATYAGRAPVPASQGSANFNGGPVGVATVGFGSRGIGGGGGAGPFGDGAGGGDYAVGGGPGDVGAANSGAGGGGAGSYTSAAAFNVGGAGGTGYLILTW